MASNSTNGGHMYTSIGLGRGEQQGGPYAVMGPSGGVTPYGSVIFDGGHYQMCPSGGNQLASQQAPVSYQQPFIVMPTGVQQQPMYASAQPQAPPPNHHAMQPTQLLQAPQQLHQMQMPLQQVPSYAMASHQPAFPSGGYQPPLMPSSMLAHLPCPPLPSEVMNIAQQQPNNNVDNNICKDFLVGRCIRHQCKFVHLPPNVRPFPDDVCKDFIRGSCARPVCRFFHGTPQEYLNVRALRGGVGGGGVGSSTPHQNTTTQSQTHSPNSAMAISVPTGHSTPSVHFSIPPNPMLLGVDPRVHLMSGASASEGGGSSSFAMPRSLGTVELGSGATAAPSHYDGAGQRFWQGVDATVQAGSPMRVDKWAQTTPRLAERESLWRQTHSSSDIGV